MKKLSVKEYSELFRITQAGVYKRIEKGNLKTLKDKDKVFIIVEDDEIPKQESKENTESLKDKIKHLEEMLQKEVEARERSEKDKENLNKRLEEANQIIAMGQQNINKLSDSIKQIEHKSEIIEEELIREKSKNIWQRIFKK